MRSNARIKVEGREKETSDIGRQVRQKKTAHSELRSQHRDRRKPVRKRRSTSLFSVARKVAVSKTSFFQTIGTLRSASYQKKGSADQVRIVPSSTSANMPKLEQKSSNMIERNRAGTQTQCGFPTRRKTVRAALSATRQLDQKTVHWSAHDMELAFQNAHSSCNVKQHGVRHERNPITPDFSDLSEYWWTYPEDLARYKTWKLHNERHKNERSVR